jgi:glutamate/tyrosine decarboxylase-like PLP-dependent enzyme
VRRTRELRLLETLYDECSGDAVATAAIVTGEAGAGKSRILSEWLAKLEQRSPRPEVWVGRGDPVAAGSPLGLLASALRSALGLENGEPDAAEQRRIRARVGRHVSEENVGRLTEFLAEIVGVPFPAEHSVGLRSARGDPMLMGDQMRRAFEDFVVAETSAGPVVLVLEDAHWGDLASVRFLEAALRQARQRPLLAVVSGRPELVTAYPSLAALRGALRVDVGELPKKACEQFVEDILQGAVDRATRDVIVERAAGNAFFLEELVRFVAEGKSAEMPPTIIATLETKLQGLPAEARRLLRAASIFGNTFWADGARTLLGDTSSRARTEPAGNAQPSADVAHAMDVVVAADLVEARPTSRFPGEQELAFWHALVRDAAYQTLTERDRAAGHRLAGEWLLTAGERDAALLGEHFERGGAGGRAAACFTEAARQSLDRHDFSGALAFVARARRACAELAPPEEGALFLLAAEAHRWSGALGEAEDAARRALELLPRGSAAWFHAAEQLAALAGVHSDFRPAVLWRERIARGPCEPGAAEARLLALCAVGRRLFQLGDYAADEVVDFIESERRTSGGELDARVEAEVRRLLGARARHRGDVAGDLAHYEAALAAYERAGDVRGQTNALVSVAFSFIQLGDWTAARVRLQRALDEAKRHGLSPIATRAHQNLSLVLLAEGAFEEAARGAARVADEAKARGDVRFEGWTQVYVSRIALARGDAAAAVAAADRALACLGGSPPAYAGALAARALAVLAAGEPEEADVAAGEALAILEEYAGIEEFESLVYLASVKAAAAAGDVARAGRLAETAVARLDARASAIPDERLRASFLGEVPENAQLCAAAAALASTAPERDRARGRIDAVWSAAAFRRDAEVVIGRVAAHLDEAMSGRGYVTRGFPPPDALLAQAAGELSEEPTADLAALLEAVLARSPWQHHPRYVGHQVAATVPRATLLSLVASVLNNGMAAFESGPYVTVLERRVIDLLLAVAGMPSSGGGVLTSGGSLGNLTALLAARQAALGDSARGRGLAEAEPLAILASDQAHYSVERAAQIMGLGRESVVLVATDASYRMIPDEIPRACERARDLGRRPFAIVASAGATGTGAIDPLPRVADASETLGLWLHVDGAHGASALLSPRYRAALGGVERADSLVWDAHKMMSMPALATAVLFRDGRAPYATFAQSAAYLFEDRAEPPWFDIGLRTVECTKPLIALPLYGCLATLGTRVFADAIESAYDRARELAGLLRAAPDFELACEPDTNIVCFRYVRDGATDELQRSVRDRLRASGAFYCVTTVLRGRTYLRVSLMNPLTTRADLTALLEAIRSAVKLLAEGL